MQLPGSFAEFDHYSCRCKNKCKDIAQKTSLKIGQKTVSAFLWLFFVDLQVFCLTMCFFVQQSTIWPLFSNCVIFSCDWLVAISKASIFYCFLTPGPEKIHWESKKGLSLLWELFLLPVFCLILLAFN